MNLTYNGEPTPPTAAGSYAVVATLNEVNYSGTATGTLVISSGDAVDLWRASHFTPGEITAGLAADSMDADGDGFTNRAEYALGTDPRLFTPQPLALTPDSNSTFTLRFHAVPASGAGYAGRTRTYAVEVTTDLANPDSWQGLSGYTDIDGSVQPADQAIPLPIDDTRKFYRLSVRVE